MFFNLGSSVCSGIEASYNPLISSFSLDSVHTQENTRTSVSRAESSNLALKMHFLLWNGDLRVVCEKAEDVRVN